MPHLTKACDQLFSRTPDEVFPDLMTLYHHCHEQKKNAVERWYAPSDIEITLGDGSPTLNLADDGHHAMNNWSFSQICRIARVSKDTVNKVRPDTAVEILRDTLPGGTKPLQFLTEGTNLRSIHGSTYTRLYNVDLLDTVNEFAVDFQPAQEGIGAGSGLYCGEEDLFVFLIDPLGWCEIEDEAYAPGFFIFNSEVGKRTVGIQTFWFQAVCQNHIVWDATDVTEFSRKHTARVHDSLDPIRTHIEQLARKRDERRDGFVNLIKKAIAEKLGKDDEEALKQLTKRGFNQSLAKEALRIAKQQGEFTIFSIVDALTRLAGKNPNAGERTELDTKASRLLSLVN